MHTFKYYLLYLKIEIMNKEQISNLSFAMRCFYFGYDAYQTEVCKELYNSWYNRVSYKHRLALIEEHKAKFSEKMLDGFMHTNYQANIYQHRALIIQLETKYRDLCGVRDAFINKGKYLQTLRSLIEIDHKPFIKV